MDFQETFQATANDHFLNYYKNETYFENKNNTYVSTCISMWCVHIKFANITINSLQGAIKLTLH